METGIDAKSKRNFIYSSMLGSACTWGENDHAQPAVRAFYTVLRAAMIRHNVIDRRVLPLKELVVRESGKWPMDSGPSLAAGTSLWSEEFSPSLLGGTSVP